MRATTSITRANRKVSAVKTVGGAVSNPESTLASGLKRMGTRALFIFVFAGFMCGQKTNLTHGSGIVLWQVKGFVSGPLHGCVGSPSYSMIKRPRTRR